MLAKANQNRLRRIPTVDDDYEEKRFGAALLEWRNFPFTNEKRVGDRI